MFSVVNDDNIFKKCSHLVALKEDQKTEKCYKHKKWTTTHGVLEKQMKLNEGIYSKL